MSRKVVFHPEMLADIAAMPPEDQTKVMELLSKIQQAAESSDDENEFQKKLRIVGVTNARKLAASEVPAEVLERLHHVATKQ